MKRSLTFMLSLALLLGPGLPALNAAESAAAEAKTETAPELPETKDGGEVKDVPEEVTGTAEVETPTDVLAKPGEAKPEEKEARFKISNFALGFLGGAALGAAVGILVLSQGDNGFDQEKAKVMGPLAAGIGGLAFGTVSLLLGATTPEAAKPPKVDASASAGRLAQGLGAKVTLSF
jgi:hypothetical protein